MMNVVDAPVSSGWLQCLLDASLHGMIVYEAVRADGQQPAITDLRIALLNEAAKTALNIPDDNRQGQTLSRLWPQLVDTPFYDQLVSVLDTGTACRFIFPLTHPTRPRWFEVSATYVAIAQQGLISYADITESYQTPSPIPQETDEFKQVLDNAFVAISHFKSVRDASGTIVDFEYESFNQAAERVTGLTAQQVIGKRMLDLFPGHRGAFFDRWVALVASGQPTRFQDHYQADGYDFWFDTQGVPWKDGFIRSYIDITSSKKAELAQQQQAELLNSLLAAAPVAFAQYEALRDGQGEIIDFTCVNANQAAADALQYPLGQLIGLPMTVINPTIKSSYAFDHYLSVTTTGKPVQYVRQLGVQWFQVSLVRFQDGFVSASIDVTESRLHQQQLEAANSELLHSNDNLQQFAYVASHDLQEPLRKIQSFGDLIGERYAPELGTFGLDALHRMQSAAGRMSLLINDLLIYSRISTQRRPFKPIDLEQVLLDVLTDFDLRFTETGAVLEYDPLPVVAGDASQLRQLFHNLLTNALKFQPLNQPDHRPKLEIRCQRTETDGRAWYELRFTDNGIGFDPRYVDRIFQVFQRLHTKQVYEGTGVGLAICHRVTDSHGGTISAESQPGQGATFLVRLPA